jgi:hypothetical protein
MVSHAPSLAPGMKYWLHKTKRSLLLSGDVLTRAQVYECLAYYDYHRAEIDTLIARQMSPEL